MLLSLLLFLFSLLSNSVIQPLKPITSSTLPYQLKRKRRKRNLQQQQHSMLLTSNLEKFSNITTICLLLIVFNLIINFNSNNNQILASKVTADNGRRLLSNQQQDFHKPEVTSAMNGIRLSKTRDKINNNERLQLETIIEETNVNSLKQIHRPSEISRESSSVEENKQEENMMPSKIIKRNAHNESNLVIFMNNYNADSSSSLESKKETYSLADQTSGKNNIRQEREVAPVIQCASGRLGGPEVGKEETFMNAEEARINNLLMEYYNLDSSPSSSISTTTTTTTTTAQENSSPTLIEEVTTSNSANSTNTKPQLAELPKPMNVKVLIMSWYPPILKLTWHLNVLDGVDISRLNFYETPNDNDKNGSFPESSSSNQSITGTTNKLLSKQILDFDLDLALGGSQQKAANEFNEPKDVNNGLDHSKESVHPKKKKKIEDLAVSGYVSRIIDTDDYDEVNDTIDVDLSTSTTSQKDSVLEELRRRRFLIEKSLTCFQVTYNIINSRFKVIEEYPPYLRSITLERLLPATEYSLQVVAIYLNGKYKRPSERVQFVSPTDNESRRFKENTYRPIHRYPDRKQKLKYGLEQTRSEELTIVAIAIAFWFIVIYIFFNNWGKIRMLEPYQPAYRESPSTAALINSVHNPLHSSMHNLMDEKIVAAGAGGTTGSIGGSVGGGAGMAPLSSIGFVGGVLGPGQKPMVSCQAGNASFCASLGGTISPSGAGSSLPSQVTGRQVSRSARGQSMQSTSKGELETGEYLISNQTTPDQQQQLNHAVHKQQQQRTGSGTITPTQAASSSLALASAAARSLDPAANLISCRKLTAATAAPPLSMVSSVGMTNKQQPILLNAHKRFQTLAGGDFLRRTDTDLSYLFQAKAQALVKASLWSRQQRFRNRMASQSRMPELEMLSSCIGGAGAGNAPSGSGASAASAAAATRLGQKSSLWRRSLLSDGSQCSFGSVGGATAAAAAISSLSFQRGSLAGSGSGSGAPMTREQQQQHQSQLSSLHLLGAGDISAANNCKAAANATNMTCTANLEHGNKIIMAQTNKRAPEKQQSDEMEKSSMLELKSLDRRSFSSLEKSCTNNGNFNFNKTPSSQAITSSSAKRPSTPPDAQKQQQHFQQKGSSSMNSRTGGQAAAVLNSCATLFQKKGPHFRSGSHLDSSGLSGGFSIFAGSTSNASSGANTNTNTNANANANSTQRQLRYKRQSRALDYSAISLNRVAGFRSLEIHQTTLPERSESPLSLLGTESTTTTTTRSDLKTIAQQSAAEIQIRSQHPDEKQVSKSGDVNNILTTTSIDAKVGARGSGEEEEENTNTTESGGSVSLTTTTTTTGADHHQFGAPNLELSPSNKLRRLLFISKSHQHHHLATSISSSTLIQRDSDSNNNSQSVATASSYQQLKMNSSSLDSAYKQPTRSRQIIVRQSARAGSSTGCETPAAVGGVNSMNMGGCGGGGEGILRARRFASMTPEEVRSGSQQQLVIVSPAISSSSLPAVRVEQVDGNSDDGGKKSEANLSANTREDKITDTSNTTTASKQVHHHILIEPPSPPPQSSQEYIEQHQQQASTTCSFSNDESGYDYYYGTEQETREAHSAGRKQLEEVVSFEEMMDPIDGSSGDCHYRQQQLQRHPLGPPDVVVQLKTPDNHKSPDGSAEPPPDQQQQEQSSCRCSLNVSDSSSCQNSSFAPPSETCLGGSLTTTTTPSFAADFGSSCRGCSSRLTQTTGTGAQLRTFNNNNRRHSGFQKQSHLVQDLSNDNNNNNNASDNMQEQTEIYQADNNAATNIQATPQQLQHQQQARAGPSHSCDRSCSSDSFARLASVTSAARHQLVCSGLHGDDGCGGGARGSPMQSRCYQSFRSFDPPQLLHSRNTTTSEREGVAESWPQQTTTLQPCGLCGNHLVAIEQTIGPGNNNSSGHCSCCSEHYNNQQHQYHHQETPTTTITQANYYDEAEAGSGPASEDLGAESGNSSRPRISSVFAASPYSRAHRDSFAMLRALSQKKSKSAEDVAYLSSLVLQIWVRDRNPLLQSATSQQQLANNRRRSTQTSTTSARQQQSSNENRRSRQRPKSSLTVAHL